MAKGKGTSARKDAMSENNLGAVVSLRLDEILVNATDNLRKFMPSAKKVAEMADSIAEYGLMNPLLVSMSYTTPGAGEDPERFESQPNGYKLVAGYTRFMAMQVLVEDGRWKADHQVPVHIATDTTDKNKSALQLLNLEENVRRNELSYIDLAHAVIELKANGMKTEDIAKRIGKTAAWISYVLKFPTLRDSIQKKIHEGTINFRLARTLSTLDETEQDKVIAKVEAGEGGTEVASDAVKKRGKLRNGSGRAKKADEKPEKTGLSSKKAVLMLGEVVDGLKEQEKVSKAETAFMEVAGCVSKFLAGKMGVKAFQNKVTALL